MINEVILHSQENHILIVLTLNWPYLLASLFFIIINFTPIYDIHLQGITFATRLHTLIVCAIYKYSVHPTSSIRYPKYLYKLYSFITTTMDSPV